MASAKTGGSFVPSSAVIPANARKAVEDLREVLKGSSEEEIYGMLRECNMDPNETVQRLMIQDTFHEVKRKRDRKKENTNRDCGDARMRPSGSGLLSRSGRMVDGRADLSTGYGRGNVVYQRNRVSNVAIAVTPYSTQSHPKLGPSKASASVPVSVASGSSVLRSGLSPASLHSSGSTGPRVSSIDTKASGAPECTATDLHPVIQSAASHNCKISSISEVQHGPHLLVSIKPHVSELVSTSKQDVSLVEGQKSTGDQGAPFSAKVGAIKSQEAAISSVDAGNPVEPGIMSPSEITRTGVARASTLNNQYNNTSIYQPQQQPSGTHKEWKPKLSATNSSPNQAAGEKPSVGEDIGLSSPVSPSDTRDVMPDISSNLEGLSLQDSQLVVIPHYLQVQDVDLSYLRFGSFRAGFVNTFNTGLDSEDNIKPSTMDAYTQLNNVPNEQLIKGSSSAEVNLTTYNQQCTSNDLEPSNSRSKISADFPSSDISTTDTAVTSEPDISKADPIIQQGTHHPYVAAGSSYSGLALPSQTVGARYSYNSSESQLQEVSRLRSFVQPYPDSTNFYSRDFHGNSDVEAPYGHLISTNNSSKFNGGISLLSGQSLSSSQEGVNSVVHSVASLAGQLSQSAGVGHMTLTMPQQHLAIHPYPGQPAGLPVSPFATNVFGYQFVPPNYAYMHAFYQNYGGNTGYTQLPAGSSYASAGGGNTYSLTGGAMVKYPMPQYKTLIAAGGTPHTPIVAGYGSSAPLFAVNPAASTVNASGYDDVTASQYKAEGSGVWIQAQSSRDMAGLQTNSYYNITGQGQHAGYMHTQAMNAHPAVNYASLYQLPQPNPSPGAHQLLQQPQALGAIGAAATSYQQGRSQVNWASNY